MNCTLRIVALVIAAFPFAAAPSAAQEYPSRPISLMVPYAAGGPTDIVDRSLACNLLGGQVDLLCDQTTQTTHYIRAGRVKAYGATSATRVETLKDLPTLAEAGLPGFEVVVWHGVYAPKGTPKPVLEKLVAALQSGLQDPQFALRMSEPGAQVVTREKATPDGLRTHLKAEIDRWTPIIRTAGVQAE